VSVPLSCPQGGASRPRSPVLLILGVLLLGIILGVGLGVGGAVVLYLSWRAPAPVAVHVEEAVTERPAPAPAAGAAPKVDQPPAPVSPPPAPAKLEPAPMADDPPPPVAPPAALRPAPLAADRVTLPLPSAVSAVCPGGGGRFLILHLPRERKLAVFDVTEARVVKYVSVPEDNVKFAADLDRLFVACPTANTLQRWSLTTFEREVTVPCPVSGRASSPGTCRRVSARLPST
jgi:hypothetical protein